jgi:hypothetical protein
MIVAIVSEEAEGFNNGTKKQRMETEENPPIIGYFCLSGS